MYYFGSIFSVTCTVIAVGAFAVEILKLIGLLPVDKGTSLDNGPYIVVFVALTLLAGHSIFSVMTEQYIDAVGEREQQLFERLVREQQELKEKELMGA